MIKLSIVYRNVFCVWLYVCVFLLLLSSFACFQKSINLCRFEINACTQSGMWIHVKSVPSVHIKFYLLSILRQRNKESTYIFFFCRCCWNWTWFFLFFFSLSPFCSSGFVCLPGSTVHIAYRIYLNGNHSVDIAILWVSIQNEMTTTITDNRNSNNKNNNKNRLRPSE